MIKTFYLYGRADHNHFLQKISQHIRDNGYAAFNYEAFSDVLAYPLSGLTHAGSTTKC